VSASSDHLGHSASSISANNLKTAVSVECIALCRLKIWKQVVVLEVFHKLRANESLKQLGNNGQIRDRLAGLNGGWVLLSSAAA